MFYVKKTYFIETVNWVLQYNMTMCVCTYMYISSKQAQKCFTSKKITWTEKFSSEDFLGTVCILNLSHIK